MKNMRMASISMAALLATGSLAHATDGYFQTGYGQKVVAMGGASDGVVTGAMGGANNPASISFAGETFSIGGTFFVPHRSATRTGNAYGLNGTTTSKNDNFGIPEIGYSTPINDQFAFGITIYGNGGLNTDYPNGTLQCPNPQTGQLGAGNILCGTGHLGVNLEQLIVAPSISYKITPTLAIAISPQLVYQMFSAEGLQPFTGVSLHPGDVTDRGNDGALGIGVKLGVFWQVTPEFALGATYSPQADMEKFKKYAGLFAQAGAFNVPANFSVGGAYKITPQFLVAADFQRILYADVHSVGNQSSAQAPLGASNGPGFGWRDINVYKLGASYKVTPQFTIRGGYTHSDNPVSPQNVTFNILAPGIIENQISVGLTYHITPQNDVTMTYMHGFRNTVTGPTSPLLPGGGTDRISLEENSIGLGFLHKFAAPQPAMAPPPAPMPVAAPAPMPARTYLVFFDWNKADLTPRATQIVAEAAADSHRVQTTTLNVSGYTDTSGTPAYNQKLSMRRANNVAAQLVTDGVAKSEIEIRAYGETHLLVPTGPGVREPQNRRVEIILN